VTLEALLDVLLLKLKLIVASTAWCVEICGPVKGIVRPVRSADRDVLLEIAQQLMDEDLPVGK